MPYLDPTLDVVFKLLLTREPALLRDMLQGILGRPVGEPAILNPGIPGELAGDKQIVLDIRAILADRSRVDLEMQRCTVPALIGRCVYYVARDYSNQLRRGKKYHLLTPTIGIIWLAEPMVPALDRFHSVFELRERHTNQRLSDHLAIHLIQLSAIPSEDETDDDEDATRVRRWARFFAARDEAEFDRLAQEDPIMEIAKDTLEQISLDPSVRRQLLEREDSEMLYKMHIAASRVEGEAAGKLEGQVALLLKLLGLRFGSLPSPVRARVTAAEPEQIESWAEQILTATTLDEVFAA